MLMGYDFDLPQDLQVAADKDQAFAACFFDGCAIFISNT